MSRKFQYVAENQDPELSARIREVMVRVIHEQLDEIETLSTTPITTPYKVDPRSSRAAEQFLDNHKGMEAAHGARKRRMADSVRLIEAAQNLIVKPKHKADADDATTQHDQDRATAMELLKAARGSLDESEHRKITAEFGDDFNLPMPAPERDSK